MSEFEGYKPKENLLPRPDNPETLEISKTPEATPGRDTGNLPRPQTLRAETMTGASTIRETQANIGFKRWALPAFHP